METDSGGVALLSPISTKKIDDDDTSCSIEKNISRIFFKETLR